MDSNKKVLLIYRGDPFDLPPMMTIIDVLLEMGHHIIVVYQEKDKNVGKFEALYAGKSVEFIHFAPIPQGDDIRSKFQRRYRRDILFKKEVAKIIKTTQYDILWIIHEFTAILLNDVLRGRHYVMSIYELRDTEGKILEGMTPSAQNADVVIVPEYNRAHMLRHWMKLKETPMILPNKPFYHPAKRNIPCEFSEDFKAKKIILYQGHISRDRNLEGMCQAVEGLDGFELVLMGSGDEFKNYLLSKYHNVKCIGFVNPPHHLDVTSWAYIAVVTYDYGSLNRLYCAPNKTWEYSGFGIPMLANDIPGLATSVGAFGAAECVDMDNPTAIKEAIEKIASDYSKYSRNAFNYYNSCDVKDIVETIIEKATK
jgi:glycosyltransferase involved in cell wall biosynthesis